MVLFSQRSESNSQKYYGFFTTEYRSVKLIIQNSYLKGQRSILKSTTVSLVRYIVLYILQLVVHLASDVLEAVRDHRVHVLGRIALVHLGGESEKNHNLSLSLSLSLFLQDFEFSADVAVLRNLQTDHQKSKFGYLICGL